MKYSFKDILTAEIYESTRVMFVFGKYTWFNNMVVDTLKEMCIEESNTGIENVDNSIEDEFGILSTESDDLMSNSVDFNTFMDVIGVASINGRWFCKADLAILNKKQIETLLKYIKDPSQNGMLVIVSDDWSKYREILKNRLLNFSKYCHVMQLSFPYRNVLKSIVGQSFLEKGKTIDNGAIDFFLTRMSSAYEEYEDTINDIVDMHEGEVITTSDLKVYMKNIENFVIDDFVNELVNPRKKTLKIMSILIDGMGAKNVVYQVLNKVDEIIEYRTLINRGFIPIGISYSFADILQLIDRDIKQRDEEAGKHTEQKELEKLNKYKNVNEWVFRKKAMLASQTSLRDWLYIKLTLKRAIEDVTVSETIMDEKCKKALYDISTRLNMSNSRIDNIIGLDNVLDIPLYKLDNTVFNEDGLKAINNSICKANEA